MPGAYGVILGPPHQSGQRGGDRLADLLPPDVSEPCGHLAHRTQHRMLRKSRVVVEGYRLSQGRVDPAEDGEHDGDRFGGCLAGEPGCEGHA